MVLYAFLDASPFQKLVFPCTSYWHLPCRYLRQVAVVEGLDGTLCYHHEFKSSLAGMCLYTEEELINSTLRCCAGWDTEGNLQ